MANLSSCPTCGMPVAAEAEPASTFTCRFCGATAEETPPASKSVIALEDKPKPAVKQKPPAVAKAKPAAKREPAVATAQPIPDQVNISVEPSAPAPKPKKPAAPSPAPAAAGFVVTEQASAASNSSASTIRRPNKNNKQLPLFLGIGGVAVLALLGVLGLVIAGTADQDEWVADASDGEAYEEASAEAAPRSTRPRISDEEAARRRERALALRAERDRQNGVLGGRDFTNLATDDDPSIDEPTDLPETGLPQKPVDIPSSPDPVDEPDEPMSPIRPTSPPQSPIDLLPSEPKPQVEPPPTVVETAPPTEPDQPDPPEEDDDQIAKVDPPDDPPDDPPELTDDDPPAGEPREINSPKDLEGAKVTLLTQKGFLFENTEIIEVVEDKDPGTIKSVKYAVDGKRPKLEPARALARITFDDQPYEIRWDQARKTCYLFDVKEHLAQVAVDLRKTGHMLWPKLDDEQRQEYIDEEKKYLAKVGAAFGGRMRLKETEFFLVYTDIPDSQVDAFVTKLDAMYNQMTTAFGVTPGENIWRGKATIMAFLREADYHRFEQLFMQNGNSEGTAGLHHGYSTGRVLISIYRGDDPIFFAQVLVHETSHGFLHRYKSNVHIPSWINEGVADWVANQVVPQGKQVRLAQHMAVKRLRQEPTLGGNFFTARNIDAWQYGVASSLTHTMLETNGSAYRAFIDGIKEGQPWPDALRASYGISPEQLVTGYGRSIGSPNLRP